MLQDIQSDYRLTHRMAHEMPEYLVPPPRAAILVRAHTDPDSYDQGSSRAAPCGGGSSGLPMAPPPSPNFRPIPSSPPPAYTDVVVAPAVGEGRETSHVINYPSSLRSHATGFM